MDSTSIIKSVETVTAKWTKQRKQEERGRAQSRRDALIQSISSFDQGCRLADNAGSLLESQ